MQETFKLALESFDSPHDGSMFRFVFGSTDKWIHCNSGSLFWSWNLDNNIGGIEVLVKNTFHLDSDFEFVLADFSINWHDFERQVHILSDTVRHEFEASVWWDECDGSFLIKLGKLDALMEFHVIDRNTLIASDALFFGLLFHEKLIVHT